jgi:hypothetical protein
MTTPLLERMEALFGAGFGEVRIHQDGEAAAMGAQAFARGNHLHFQPGRYDPGSTAGLELLGHELSHVVQQRAGRVSGPQGKDGIAADPALEAEADAHGARVARGESIGGSGGAGASEVVSGEAVQCSKNLTAQQTAEVARKQGGRWLWVRAVAGGHISIFLDQASQDWLWEQHEAGDVKYNANGTLDVTSLNGKVLTYDELHFTTNANVHYYYNDDGTPSANCKVTLAPSPPWANPLWATANKRIAAFLGVTYFDINVRFNQVAGPQRLPESLAEENQPQAPPAQAPPAPRPNAMMGAHALRAKQLRDAAEREKLNKQALAKKKRARTDDVPYDGKAEEGSTTEAATLELREESCKGPEAKKFHREDPEDPSGNDGISTT